MTTINPYYTLNYTQPSEYHFSHDSVLLARLAYEYIVQNNINTNSVLDLCAGCGIVGMDFLFHLKTNNKIVPTNSDFLEVQSIYSTYFIKNRQELEKILNCKIPISFLNINYADVHENLNLENKYNFIVSNPPFFRKGQGSLSPSEFKNRCRFFMDSDFENLIRSISYLLAPGGKALVLIKALEYHGVDIKSELQKSANGLTFQKINTLRGTELFELAKPLV